MTVKKVKPVSNIRYDRISSFVGDDDISLSVLDSIIIISYIFAFMYKFISISSFFPTVAVVFCLYLVTPTSAHTQSKPLWHVTHVVDGDTFYASRDGVESKYRLIGVDTPEYAHFGKPEEPYADAATEYLYEMIANRKVILKQDIYPIDKYGRTLVYVYLEDETFVNAALVRDGWATIMSIPPNVSYADLFYTLQVEARKAKRGIWQD